MPRLFRDSLEAIDGDMKIILKSLSESMSEITDAMRQLVEQRGKL